MSLQTALEAFGWLGSSIVIFSILLGNQLKFRWYNLLGSLISAIYCALVNTWPPVLMNSIIVLIDGYWIYRLIKEAKMEDKNVSQK